MPRALAEDVLHAQTEMPSPRNRYDMPTLENAPALPPSMSRKDASPVSPSDQLPEKDVVQPIFKSLLSLLI